jgi:hypothetical protein
METGHYLILVLGSNSHPQSHASQYLAAWVLLRASMREDAEAALHYVAPFGQTDEYVRRAIGTVRPYTSSADLKREA